MTNLSLSDIEHLQSVGKDAQAARQAFILKDDQENVWNHIQNVKDGRVDIVLDNGRSDVLFIRHITDRPTAGFEVQLSSDALSQS